MFDHLFFHLSLTAELKVIEVDSVFVENQKMATLALRLVGCSLHLKLEIKTSLQSMEKWLLLNFVNLVLN
jgi:hypothetical protein